MIAYTLGFIVGVLVSLLIVGTLAFFLLKYKTQVVKVVGKIERGETILPREKVTILKRKTNQEEAYSHILEMNKHRGGVTDMELHETN